jgi:hypothetical protein
MNFGKVRLYDKTSGTIIIVGDDGADFVTSMNNSADLEVIQGELKLRRRISNGPTLVPPKIGEHVVFDVDHRGLCLWGFRSRYDSLLAISA